jgi:RNA polymerase sigma factor (sigma-70 family)
VNSWTDQQLIRDYTGSRSEPAFAELARRHVDFVYSAALRMVRDTHLAEDVTQAVFVALAQSAAQLTDRPALSGWLHRTTQNLAANAVRSDVRRRAREQEAAVMHEILSAEPDAGWEQIAPQLDAALGELSEGDREALLLRYFERQSAGEMAQTLGISDEAAQKRVNRAVERLRELFAKRGIAIGASGLVAVISANAVQAAPAGLVAIVSTSAALGGTTLIIYETTANREPHASDRRHLSVGALGACLGPANTGG